jgi:hypothetical protein
MKRSHSNDAFRFFPPKGPAPSWLPDWRVESNYPDPTNADQYQFAWEFLRRNPDYQEDFEYLIKLCEREELADVYRQSLGFHYAMKNEEPYSTLFHRSLEEKLSKWGLPSIFYDPSLKYGRSHYTNLEEANARNLNFKKANGGASSIGESQSLNNNDVRFSISRLGYFKLSKNIETVTKAGQDGMAEDKHYSCDGGIVPSEHEYAWLFDISLPLQPQIAAALVELSHNQERVFDKILKATKYINRPDSLILYLRILDADVTSENNKTIADVLFTSKDPFKYQEKSDYHGNPRLDSLKQARKAAYYLLKNSRILLF